MNLLQPEMIRDDVFRLFHIRSSDVSLNCFQNSVTHSPFAFVIFEEKAED